MLLLFFISMPFPNGSFIFLMRCKGTLIRTYIGYLRRNWITSRIIRYVHIRDLRRTFLLRNFPVTLPFRGAVIGFDIYPRFLWDLKTERELGIFYSTRVNEGFQIDVIILHRSEGEASLRWHRRITPLRKNLDKSRSFPGTRMGAKNQPIYGFPRIATKKRNDFGKFI